MSAPVCQCTDQYCGVCGGYTASSFPSSETPSLAPNNVVVGSAYPGRSIFPAETRPAYQQRVIEELDDLGERVIKLRAFHGGPQYNVLPIAEQFRLTRQLALMIALSGILAERIAAFPKPG